MSEECEEGPSPKPTSAAFFDVDGTISSTDVIRTYLDFWLSGVPFHIRLLRLSRFLPKIPYYALLDTLSRPRFSKVFYRNYAKVKRSGLILWEKSSVDLYWRPRLFPQALQRIRYHREKGHRVILVSGGLELTLKSLASFLRVDAVLGAELETKGDHLTGHLVNGPMSAERKASAIKQFCADLGVEPGQSYAYSDSYSDVAFLASVGNPVAVNPDRRLRKLARRRGWMIEQWRLY